MSELDGEALLRVNRAVERFEDDWRRGAPLPLEDLVRDEPNVRSQVELLRYALAVELEFRRRRGETPMPDEYEYRFPDHRQVIQAAFAEQRTLSMSPGTTIDVDSFTAFPPQTELAPHAERLGKFEVLGRLGGGGQGAAFLARDPDVGRLVVLKRYHATGDDAAKEAKALCRVRSRYTAQCYEVTRHGGELFLVMEYIPGRTLWEVIKQGRPTPDAAARLAEQLAEGLEAVHACGLVHRDLKPSNIVVGDDGVARLVDFGLAAHLGSADLDSLSGSPHYMAPEQARRQWERIDARTDLYGLGGVLHAMLTGRPPHPGATLEDVLQHARQGMVTPPRELNRSIPPSLGRVVRKVLAADPAQRYASATELRRALRRYRHRRLYRATVGLVILAGLIPASVIWPRRVPPQVVTTPAPVALKGELTVRVWSPGNQGKYGWSVEDPRALPVLSGERVHLEAHFNRPAYAYLLWIDGQGRVASIYPWGDREFHSRSAAESARETVHSPAKPDEGWSLKGPGGLETALLLVRSTPLPEGTDLAARIGRLPPSPLRDPQELAVRGFDSGQPTTAVKRGVNRGLDEEATRIDDPLLQLMERLRNQDLFEVIKAVRFPYQGK